MKLNTHTLEIKSVRLELAESKITEVWLRASNKDELGSLSDIRLIGELQISANDSWTLTPKEVTYIPLEGDPEEWGDLIQKISFEGESNICTIKLKHDQQVKFPLLGLFNGRRIVRTGQIGLMKSIKPDHSWTNILSL